MIQMRRLAACGCLTAIILLFASCGGGSSSPDPQQQSLPVPQGVDGALWQQMQDELQQVRVEAGRDREVSMAPRELGNRVSQIGTEDSGDGGSFVGWYYQNTGDYDLNGQVTISDLTPVGVGFQSTEGSSGWFTKGVADGDRNGEVNLADITPIGVHFGNAVTGYIVEHTTTPQFLGSYQPVAEVLFSEGTPITAKVPSAISLPTETKQVYFEVKLDSLAPGDAYGIRPYFESNGVRELGIASYETKPPGESVGWPMAGGDAQHSGLSDTYFSTHGQVLYNTGGLNLGYSTTPAFDENDNYYLGTTDGRVLKLNENGGELWSVDLGWRVNDLQYFGGEFGVMALHDNGYTFLDATGSVLEQQAVGRVLSRPATFFKDASTENIAGVTASGLVFGLHLINGSGVQQSFEHDFAAPAPGNIVSSGLRLFVVLKGTDGADDSIVTLDFAGLNPQSIQSSSGIDPRLAVGADDRVWANLNGASLQSWLPDGSMDAAAVPASGLWGAFTTDTTEDRLLVANDDSGSWSIVDWDTATNSETDSQPVDQPVIQLLDSGATIAGLFGDGSVRSFDNILTQRFKASPLVDMERLQDVRIDFNPAIGSDGRLSLISMPRLGGIDNADGTILVDRGQMLNESRLNIAMQAGNASVLDRLLSGLEGQLQLTGEPQLTLGGPLDNDPDIRATSSVLTEIPLSPTQKRRRVGITFRTDVPVFEPTRKTESLRSASSGTGVCGVAMFEDDGSIAWDEFYDDEEISAPSFSFRRLLLNGSNLVSGTHRVFCLTEATGAELWSKEIDSAAAAVPVSDDDAQAYVVTESGTVHRLNEQGQDVWQESHPLPTSGLVLSGSLLFYGTADGVVAIDISDGALAFSENIPGGISATPAIGSDGSLVCVSSEGDLYMLDITGADHTPQLLFDGEGSCESQPVCDGSGLVAWLTMDGMLHCSDLGGNLLYEIDTYTTFRQELSVGPDGTLYAMDELGRIAVIGQ
ncbi:MAG: PQQ-binding-like beta-propeller repeat protein [Planctomycetales bacterium]|nr:PQQ-binding-like beta-propeller repeat protein [bacterium]UNM09000.1 MAG: PQQ-binding-like beta-propeller repeat protein [Planctomycetales bacterium]